MIQPTDTSEKAFQKLIVKALVEDQGYFVSVSNDFDREFCINKDQLMAFLEKSQLATYHYIKQTGERSFLVRLARSAAQLAKHAIKSGVKSGHKR